MRSYTNSYYGYYYRDHGARKIVAVVTILARLLYKNIALHVTNNYEIISRFLEFHADSDNKM